MVDVRQAEQLVAVAAETIPDLERLMQQEENFISTLLGNNPGPIARGMKLTEQPHLPEVPAGIPSRLLERRPDIRAAEAGATDRGESQRPMRKQLAEPIEIAPVDGLGIGEDEVPDLVGCVAHSGSFPQHMGTRHPTVRIECGPCTP